MGLGQGCGILGRSKKASDSGYVLKVDLTGCSDRLGVLEKASFNIKHNSRFSSLGRMGLNLGFLYKLFSRIDHTENPAGVTPSNLIIITSRLGTSP